jgi:hypothetical protein
MSTCAGCGVALDRSGGKGCRECPNCKAGESVEGRHFYCSNKCFTSRFIKPITPYLLFLNPKPVSLNPNSPTPTPYSENPLNPYPKM